MAMASSSACKHPQFIRNTCVCCGVSKYLCPTTLTTPFHYILPNLSLSLDEVNRIRDEDLQSLLGRKKLHLVLDLDNTLIHSTHVDLLTPKNLEYISVGQKQSKPPGAEGFVHEFNDYVVKVRPGTTAFLEELSSLFDMSVYTMGKRPYAKQVVNILDPERRFFKSVITREDCTKRGQKSLDVVLTHERMVLIVDDSRLVWSLHSENLVPIGAYRFFEARILSVQKLVELESGMNMEMGLARVMDTLKSAHTEFYAERDARKSLKNAAGKPCSFVASKRQAGRFSVVAL